MNKIYFLFPLVGLIAFGTYWYGFKTSYQKKQEEARIEAQAKIEARQEQDRKNRLQAVADAVESTNKRKAEKAAKIAREAKEKADREAAIEVRNKIKQEQYKLADQEKRLAKEVEEIKVEITKVKENVANLDKERDHVNELVKQTLANSKDFASIALKVEKADESIRKAAKELLALKKPKE